MPFISQMIAEYATTGNGSVIHILATLFFYNLVTLILYICDVACVENLISWKMFQRKKSWLLEGRVLRTQAENVHSLHLI